MKNNSRRRFLQNAGLVAAASVAPLAAAPERTKELFVHHVFFYLKEPNNAQHEAQLREGLQKLAQVSIIQFAHIGKPAETSREGIIRDYTISWMCFFKNIIEEEIYQTHPAHLDFLKNYSHLWEKMVVFDSVGPKKV